MKYTTNVALKKLYLYNKKEASLAGDKMTIYHFFAFLGGLGLFLFGMKQLSSSLESMTNYRLKKALSMLTTNPITGVLFGLLTTAFVHSSTAVTVILVGVVNASLMSLTQAASVIMGANIGTTVTAQLLAFDLSAIAPLFLFVGMVMFLFSKRTRVKRLGSVILSFGMLFVGLSLMSQSTLPLRDVSYLSEYLTYLENPLISIVLGAAFTALIQSSSASVVILQVFATSGLIGFDQAVYVVLGQNIGTCITSMLASVGTGVNSKRTAGFHLMFNVIGVVAFLIILPLFPILRSWVISLSPDSAARQVANFHTIFNLSTTIVLLPFINVMAQGVSRLIPDKVEDAAADQRLEYMDLESEEAADLAVSSTIKELSRLEEIIYKNYTKAILAFETLNEANIQQIIEREQTINYLYEAITKVMIEYQHFDLSTQELGQLQKLQLILIDLERMGNRCEDIALTTHQIIDSRHYLSEAAKQELSQLAHQVTKILELTLEELSQSSTRSLEAIYAIRNDIAIHHEAMVINHVKRLQDKTCSLQAGSYFSNVLSSLESIASHALSIANTKSTLN